MLDLSPETEALARTLAETRRLSVDAAVRGALEAQSGPSSASHTTASNRPRDAVGRDEAVRLFRQKIVASAPAKDMSPEAVAARHAAIDKIVTEMDALPELDTRSVQKIVDDINEL